MPNSALGQEVFEYKAINGNLSIDEAKGIVECFVAAVGNKDSVGDIVVAGAFDASLRRRKPRVVWGHDWNQPIGKVLEIYEVRPNDPRLPAKMKAAGVGGLYARVQFNLKSERGREAFSNILFFGEDQEWSIGYKTLQADFDQSRQANILKELELYEVSPVLHGANQLTATISVKSEKGAYGAGQMMMPMRGMLNENYDIDAEESEDEEQEDDDSIVVPGDMPYSRRAAMALSKRVGSPVRLRSLDKNMIIADVMGDEGRVMTYRLSYHFEDGKFMFGDMEAVKPTMVYLPVEDKAAGEDDVTSLRDSKWKTFDIAWAKKLQEEHPDIWDEGGNIKGNDQWRILTQIAEKGKATTQAEMNALKLREAWIARHHQDFRLPGIIAQIKWLAIGSRGEEYMKNLIREAIKKKNEKGHFDYEDFSMKEALDSFADEFHDSKAATDRVPSPTQLVPDAIPQERFTGDVLRGYGPRRGNLERLLRYWRPIMRREGGFRRCRVILADHPELYPLNNICAWLHHETTGLWPNEGCHHPGMKNCRRKLRGVVRGSLVSDSDFDRRMRELTPGKSAWTDSSYEKIGAEEDMFERMDDGEITDDDIEFANKVLREFMAQEKNFMRYIGNDSNWIHVGDDEDGSEMPHEWMKPQNAGGCGCGCGGSKSALDDLLVKAGRVLSTANMQKLEQAIVLLNEVVEAGGDASMDMGAKTSIKVAANIDDLFDVKSYLDPVVDFYNLDAEVAEDGIKINSRQGIPAEARQAIKSAVSQFLSNK